MKWLPDNEVGDVGRYGALILFVLWALFLYAWPVYSMTVLPPYPLPYEPVCNKTTFGSWQRQTCWLYGSDYTPSSGAPVSIIAPQAKGRYQVVIWRHGFTGWPIACNNDNGSRAGTIVIKPCAITYPNINDYPPWRLNWGGPWEGKNPEGLQAGEALEAAWSLFDIDHGAGITLEGTSEGASWAIIQSMIAPEFLRSQIAVVDATLPHTLIVKTTTDPSVFAAWGNYDLSLMDFRVQAASGKLDNVYFRIRGATNDSLGRISTDFFRACDTHRVACYGTWDMGGHSATGEVGVNLPRGLYNAGQQPIRRDGILPVFTNSTADQWGERGFHGLGLSATTARRMSSGEGYVLGIRYWRHTNMGADIPDQPEQATFDLTLRRIKLAAGEYSYIIGEQTGTVTVSGGTLTIEQITLESSEQYSTLTVTRD